VWNPFLIKDITAIEKVQRRFTKRLSGMGKLTYYQRLVKVGDKLTVKIVSIDPQGKGQTPCSPGRGFKRFISTE